MPKGPTPALHDAAWFEEALKSTPPVPTALRRISETLCKQFNIRGICDPMYIANTLAYELGVGDGRSKFNTEKLPAVSPDALSKAVNHLLFAYSSCFQGESEKVTDIVSAELTLCRG